MLAYTTIGTNNFDNAKEVYGELFSVLGVKQLFATDRFCGFGTEMGQPMFAVCKPFNEAPATGGNGSMVTISCSDEQVQSLHQKALDLGFTDEGAPGLRAGTFYISYVRDVDGNKIAFYAPARG